MPSADAFASEPMPSADADAFASEAEFQAALAERRFQARIAEVQNSVRSLPPGSDEETQDELGLLLRVLPVVERNRDSAVLGNIELAVEALLSQPPNRLLAIRLREAAQQSVFRRGFFRAILPGSSASSWVIAGMACLVFIAIPTTLFLTYSLLWDAFSGPDETARFFVFVAVAGAIGSVISILVRIRDFTEIRILNPPALFWTGFFKPIIGAAFALFVFFAFESELVFVNPEVNERFMYVTLGFVAGFSERFAPDLVSRLERSIGASEGRQAEPPGRSG